MDRETVIALAREAGILPEANPVMPQLLERFAALVAAHEREECAKVCDEIDRRWINQADKCAAAIRSRT